MEFQSQMCCRENLMYEREILQRRLREKLEYQATIQHKQAGDFHALLCKHDTLCRDFNTLQKELKSSEEEHGCLCSENNDLDEKLDEHCKTIETLKRIRSTHLGIAEGLKNQLRDEADIKQKLQNGLQVVELEQKAIDRTTIDVQNKLAEQITELAELEKSVNTEENQSEHLVLSINELRIRSEKLNRSLQNEDVELKNQLNEKLAALEMVKQNIVDKQAEIESYKNRITECSAKIKTLQKGRSDEKCEFDLEVCKLKAEITATTSKLSVRCAKLCELQKVITFFEGHLKDQDLVISSLESTNERALEKVKRTNETTESMRKTIETVREQREKEKENSVMELAKKIQEKCKLEVLIKNQLEQITELQKQIFDQQIGKLNVALHHTREGDQ